MKLLTCTIDEIYTTRTFLDGLRWVSREKCLSPLFDSYLERWSQSWVGDFSYGRLMEIMPGLEDTHNIYVPIWRQSHSKSFHYFHWGVEL